MSRLKYIAKTNVGIIVLLKTAWYERAAVLKGLRCHIELSVPPMHLAVNCFPPSQSFSKWLV